MTVPAHETIKIERTKSTPHIRCAVPAWSGRVPTATARPVTSPGGDPFQGVGWWCDAPGLNFAGTRHEGEEADDEGKGTTWRRDDEEYCKIAVHLLGWLVDGLVLTK